MCEYSDYYQDCNRGSFARANASECGCRGHGWFLSQVDTWHQCPAHWTPECRHPEDDRQDEADGEPEGEREPVPETWPVSTRDADDGLPF